MRWSLLRIQLIPNFIHASAKLLIIYGLWRPFLLLPPHPHTICCPPSSLARLLSRQAPFSPGPSVARPSRRDSQLLSSFSFLCSYQTPVALLSLLCSLSLPDIPRSLSHTILVSQFSQISDVETSSLSGEDWQVMSAAPCFSSCHPWAFVEWSGDWVEKGLVLKHFQACKWFLQDFTILWGRYYS